ncbi:LysM peptidoglycan-binding domain-containing protein [Oscillospiraceae bacterium 44-34]
MRKLKKAFSLTLALALSLALAAPAFAADTVKVLEDKEYGVKVTLNGFLREETHRYYVDGIFYYDEDTGEPITEEAREFTICVVADNSTVTLEALEGWKYGDPVLEGINKWTYLQKPADQDSPEYAAHQDFMNNMESYAYDGGYAWWWDPELKRFHSENGPAWPLVKAVTNTVSPTEEGYTLYLDLGYGVAWMCESDYAKLVPVGMEQPGQSEQPTEPGQPAVPDAPGTYTVKKGDSWSSICTNFYGTNAQRYELIKANKNAALKEGAVITLPEKLGKDTLIPAPTAGEGEKLYTVKAGDTLGKIAAAEYGRASEYQAIFERNTDRLKNINTIYEGQVIVLPAKK